MKMSDLQSVRYLVKREICELEAARNVLRLASRKKWDLAVPGSNDGEVAFEDLNSVRSQLRVVNQRLRKMRALTYSIKDAAIRQIDRAYYDNEPVGGE